VPEPRDTCGLSALGRRCWLGLHCCMAHASLTTVLGCLLGCVMVLVLVLLLLYAACGSHAGGGPQGELVSVNTTTVLLTALVLINCRRPY
jgi:hypothetical protein